MQGEQYSAILNINPNAPMEAFERERAYKDQQAMLEEQQRRYNEGRELQMAQYMTSQLDFEKFATGTVHDPIILSSLNTTMKEIAAKIRGGASPSEIVFEAADKSKSLADYSLKAKTIDAQLKAGAAQFAKDPSIDVNQMYALGKTLAFTDGNGGVKPINDVDMNADYLSLVVEKYPELISKSDAAMKQYLKGMEMVPYENRTEVPAGFGVKKKFAYKGKYNPALHELTFQGNPVKSSTEIADGVRPKGEIKDYGNNIRLGLAPLNIVEDFENSSLGAKVYLNAQAKQIQRSNPNVSTEEAKQVVVYEFIKNDKAPFINQTLEGEDTSQRDAYLMRKELMVFGDKIADANRREREGSSDKKESPFAVLGKAASGQWGDGVRNENGRIEITNILPGAALYSGKLVKSVNGSASKTAYSSVEVDPTTGDLYVTETEYELDANGFVKTKTIAGREQPIVKKSEARKVTDRKRFVRQIAQANDKSPDKAWEEFNSNYQVPSSSQLQIEKDLEEAQQKRGLRGFLKNIWK